MTNDQKNVRDWMLAFSQSCPEKPIVPSLEVRKLRAKLILEEAFETCFALGFDFNEGHLVDDLLAIATKVEPNLTLIADGCEDLKVVTEGTLVACGLVGKDINYKKVEYFDVDDNGESIIGSTIRYLPENNNDPLFDEVMRSNWSKMWTYQEVAELPDYHPEDCLEVNPHPQSERSHRGWLVKDKDGKVIKSPSYSLANLQPIIDSL